MLHVVFTSDPMTTWKWTTSFLARREGKMATPTGNSSIPTVTTKSLLSKPDFEGARDNSYSIEEPDEANVSRPVLKPGGRGDPGV